MSRIKIKDNSRISKESLACIGRLTNKIADKTLEELESEGIFVFPEIIKEAEDITKDQIILQSVNNYYQSGNVMGFMGLGDEKLIIESRFSSQGQDFLFQYLLERVFDVPNIVDLETDANNDDRIFNLLIFIFPHYLRSAMRKGVFKTYVRKKYNDGNVKGTVDIARHIAKNTPFVGKVAYSKREYSFDNDLMELIRHTIEFIRYKPYGSKILAQVKDEVKDVISATSNYQVSNRQKVIDVNKTNVIRHAFYREYRELQNLCLLILQHQKHNIGMGSKKVYGLLFDGAWLWEEYINSIVGILFYHPMNKAAKGAQRLFDHNRGLIYPDFISKNADTRVIADAKYKPIDNIGNKDYLQILAYMFRFDAKKGFYFYPEMEKEKDFIMRLNSGSTYEKNVEVRNDVCIIKHGFKIPIGLAKYEDFTEQMRYNEKQFLDGMKML
jgi:conserved domain protein